MTFEYFSDREKGKIEKSTEIIPKNVWNGIVSIYKKLINNNKLSNSFPLQCSDGLGVYSCDETLLENSIQAEIPNLKIPITSLNSYGYGNFPDTYDILDFVEFLYKNITDTDQGSYHSFFDHYHLLFNASDTSKKEFISDINLLLDRNGLVYYLNNNGIIERTLPSSIKIVVDGIRKKSEDDRLNDLFEIAYSKIIMPKSLQRLEGLEKLWDCFERLKTYYDEKNKSRSAGTLVDQMSENNELFKEYINSEFQTLTKIGNGFQIRHFERDKIQLTDNSHIDYLFYRMSCLITLALIKIKSL